MSAHPTIARGAADHWTTRTQRLQIVRRAASGKTAPLMPQEIVTYVNQRLPGLKREGNEFRGACPVHKGIGASGNSFSLNAETGQCYCHSECNRGWNVFTLERELGGTGEDVFEIVGRDLAKGADFEHAYHYVDENGLLIRQNVRFEWYCDGERVKKEFRQRIPDGNGGWIWKTAGVREVPYRLPELLTADEVCLVEGEKDADNLVNLGYVATTNCGGVKKFTPDLAKFFEGKHVVLFFDDDKAGRAGLVQRVGLLTGVAREVRVVHLTDGAKDVSDWLALGHTRDDLQARIDAAEVPDIKVSPYKTQAPAVVSRVVPRIEALIKTRHHFARDAGGLLYSFDKGVYRPIGQRLVEREVKGFCQGSKENWTPELASRVAEYIAVDAPELLERPPIDTVNVKNGLLDVASRKLREHSPEFLSPVQIDATYHPGATCPAIDRFCNDVLPDDARHILGEMAGWLMLPETSIQKAVLLIGDGANGKSVFLTLLEDFLGEHNVSSVTLHKLEINNFAASRLVGKLANICADLPTAGAVRYVHL
jgi:putative DNA primase/helicase